MHARICAFSRLNALVRWLVLVPFYLFVFVSFIRLYLCLSFVCGCVSHLLVFVSFICLCWCFIRLCVCLSLIRIGVCHLLALLSFIRLHWCYVTLLSYAMTRHAWLANFAQTLRVCVILQRICLLASARLLAVEDFMCKSRDGRTLVEHALHYHKLLVG